MQAVNDYPYWFHLYTKLNYNIKQHNISLALRWADLSPMNFVFEDRVQSSLEAVIAYNFTYRDLHLATGFKKSIFGDDMNGYLNIKWKKSDMMYSLGIERDHFGAGFF